MPYLGDFAGGCQEAGPRGPGERAAHADAANADDRQLADRSEVAAHQHVHRRRRDGLHDGANAINRRQPRRVHAIGTGLGKRRQPPDHIVQVRTPDEECFGPRGQDDAGAGPLDGFARRADAIDCELEPEQWFDGLARQSSMERPAMPVVTASITFAATPSGVTAKPCSKSALTGTVTARQIDRTCASTSRSATWLSGRPEDQAIPSSSLPAL